MKYKFVLLIFTFALSGLFADTVNWLSEYDKALAAAQEEDKNIFVLITAPSWCVWCQRLEENVLSKPEFQSYLTENYIPLKLLDKVDGVRNPELAGFDFSGYPSVFLYDKKGQFIENIYTQDPVAMVNSMRRYKSSQGVFKPLLKDLKLPEKYTFSADGGGEYINRNDGTWYLKTGSETIEYKQMKYDYEYLYLEHARQEHVIALPMKGTDRHMATLQEGNWVWSDLSDVIRIGGDPYFD
ncbi:MAG: thioredoxin family protein [Spirochaetales bacterium]|nr:thioredoxin family protein [Spirochaetales bacterium]